MFIPPLADRTKAEALVARLEGSIFSAIFDHLSYFTLSLFLGIFTIFVIPVPLHELPAIAVYIIFLIVFIGLAIGSVFLLRKLRSRNYRELKAIYAELFFEGFNEEQIVRLAHSTMLYVLLPMRPSDSKKREIIRYKDALWRLDNYHGE